MSDGNPGARARLLVNPFIVLGLSPASSRTEVERQAQKLLSQLDAGIEGAVTYPSPVGPGRRTPEMVRWAVDQLRDPKRRLLHELWAGMPPR